jgi:hypothetical protein
MLFSNNLVIMTSSSDDLGRQWLHLATSSAHAPSRFEHARRHGRDLGADDEEALVRPVVTRLHNRGRDLCEDTVSERVSNPPVTCYSRAHSRCLAQPALDAAELGAEGELERALLEGQASVQALALLQAATNSR